MHAVSVCVSLLLRNAAKQSIFSNPRDHVAQYAVFARLPGFQPKQFQPHFGSKITDVDCPSSRSGAVIYNVSWPTMEITRRENQQPIQRTEKSICLARCIVDIFKPSEASVLDAYASTMATAMAALANNRSCTHIGNDDACFEIVLSRVMSLVGSVKKSDGSNTEE